MKSLLIFPLLRQVHIPKDPGCVVAYLQEKGVEGTIIALPNEPLDLHGFKPTVITYKRPFLLHACKHLWDTAKDVDVLILFHTNPLNVLYANIYRMRNPRGVVYIKADMDNTILSLQKITLLNIIRRIKLRMCIGIADIFSIEQEKILKLIATMHPKHKNKLLHLPNAFGGKAVKPLPFSKKKNVIVTVGPIGSRQKATDIILNVAQKLDLHDWTIVMIGAVLDEGKQELDEFFKNNPKLKTKVIIKGHISDRDEMMTQLREAKIIFMPSRWETFSLALCEAAYYGTVIVATAVGGASELTQQGTVGSICAFEDVDGMVVQLKKRMTGKTLLAKESVQTQEFCRKNYTWSTIITRLHKRILSARNSLRR